MTDDDARYGTRHPRAGAADPDSVRELIARLEAEEQDPDTRPIRRGQIAGRLTVERRRLAALTTSQEEIR